MLLLLNSWFYTPIILLTNILLLALPSTKKRIFPKFGLSPALLMLWLALCSLKLFNSIRVPHDKLKFSQISCSIWFSILPFTCLHSPRWVLVQLPRTKHEPKTGFCSLSRLAVVQIYLQGARLHRVEAPTFPCYRGSTLAAEQGERKEARKKLFKEKNTKKNPKHWEMLQVTFSYAIWSNKP